jgi:hypothetical protein
MFDILSTVSMNGQRWILSALALALVCLSGISNTWADPTATPDPSSDSSAEEKAIASARKAQGLFADGDWKKAIFYYEQAWRASPKPGFQFNLGLAYREAGENQEALSRFKMYLELEPTGPVAADAREFVRILTPIVTKELELQAAKERSEAKRREQAERDAHIARSSKSADESYSTPVQIAESSRGGGTGRQLVLAGYGSIGVGMALASVGVVFAFKAQEQDNLIAAGPVEGTWNDETVMELGRQEERQDTAKQRMYISAGVGVAALATGGVLYVLGKRKTAKESSQLSLTPKFDSTSSGLVFTTPF